MKLSFNEKTLGIKIVHNNEEWMTVSDFRPSLLINQEKIYFDEASLIEHFYGENSKSIKSVYTFEDFSFETNIWISGIDEVFFKWEQIREDVAIDKVCWPGPFEFNSYDKNWITLLNFQQGLLIPNTWQVELGKIYFEGLFNTAAATMPWFAQIRNTNGYLATCLTPWDAGYDAVHPKDGPYTHVSFYMNKSLGSMNYPRVFRYTFIIDASITTVTKRYRKYAEEEQKFKTLAEKSTSFSKLNSLIGSMVVHTSIKTKIQPESRMYNHEAPEQNCFIRSFHQVNDYIKELKKLGLEKVYIHLDGWAEPGYDNHHPDYNQPCEKAGGTKGMVELVDTIQGFNYLFGIHDQYRDYYLRAPSFTWNKAVMLEDGTHPEHANWAGGKQTYLCSEFALGYVKRNFKCLKDMGINLDAAYLDVFTCNEADECFNEDHVVSRRQGYENRLSCFEYLRESDILSSSEDMNEWALNSLVFCHYAPYDFMLREPGAPKYGIPVPLFNLVYHDCAIIPWMMEKHEEEDYFLYAILNGGIPYLRRDGAYQNIDGSFDSDNLPFNEHLERCKIVNKLHERVAMSEMTDFKILDEDGFKQQSTFDDKIIVSIDLKTGEYSIKTNS